jgi:hypothetical protein
MDQTFEIFAPPMINRQRFNVLKRFSEVKEIHWVEYRGDRS